MSVRADPLYYRYNNLSDVLAAIDRIPWLDQNTNTSGGIRMMNELQFTRENGEPLQCLLHRLLLRNLILCLLSTRAFIIID